MYHSGNRQIQARFGSTALADRLLQKTHRTAFTDADRAFIESRPFFFLASADDQGRPDCSFKGGPPGFVRVIGANELVWPDYDGNGMFKSLGNIAVNASVGLLFIAMDDAPKRLRVNGTARLSFDDPLLASFHGAQAIVHLYAEHIFPNCPRYIPNSKTGEPSIYTPSEAAPVEPAWESFDDFADVVPPRHSPAPDKGRGLE
jgi:predicted pyridoxine 5'-phosphate oxidase superfamily flavin-nucleotide-binding protein